MTDVHVGTEVLAVHTLGFLKGVQVWWLHRGDSSTEFSAKVGGAVPDVGPASVYGEVSGSTTGSDPVIS